MNPTTIAILESRGYRPMADGSLSRPDSERRVLAPLKHERLVCQKEKFGKSAKKPAQRSPLAVKFEAMWAVLGGPELTPEFRFHPTRKWQLDYYHAETMTAIELEGGIFSGGRHSRAKGMQGDCDKYNAAAAIGITVFRLTTGQITRERVEAIMQAISQRQNTKQL